MKTIKKIIEQFNPHKDIADYLNSKSSFLEAWNDCQEVYLMFWIACKLDVNERTTMLAKGYCAKAGIHLMKDERSINAVKTAIRFGRYRATVEEVHKAADEAFKAFLDIEKVSKNDLDMDAEMAYDAYASLAIITYFGSRLETADICKKYLTKSVMSKINKL